MTKSKQNEERKEIQVDFYYDTFWTGKLEIPNHVANDLKGEIDDGERVRGEKYWFAIQYIQNLICEKNGFVGRYNDSWIGIAAKHKHEFSNNKDNYGTPYLMIISVKILTNTSLDCN